MKLPQNVRIVYASFRFTTSISLLFTEHSLNMSFIFSVISPWLWRASRLLNVSSNLSKKKRGLDNSFGSGYVSLLVLLLFGTCYYRTGTRTFHLAIAPTFSQRSTRLSNSGLDTVKNWHPWSNWTCLPPCECKPDRVRTHKLDSYSYSLHVTLCVTFSIYLHICKQYSQTSNWHRGQTALPCCYVSARPTVFLYVLIT